MPRRLRVYWPGGVYYVVLSGNPGQHIFSQTSDYEDFEGFLASALANCRVSVLAFAWQRDVAHLVVQIEDIEVGRFVQRLTSSYARDVHKQHGGSGHLFRARYRALLIEPEVYLSRLIRYVHLLPLSEGAGGGVEPSRLSSHSAYLGSTRLDWLTISPELSSVRAYAELMKILPDPEDAVGFVYGSKWDSRVLSTKPWYQRVIDFEKVPTRLGDLDKVIDTVCEKLGVEREAVMSKSRQRRLALARAVIAWRWMRWYRGRLAEVARKLKRDASTLSVAIKRYRKLRPDLFTEKEEELHS